MSINKVILVGNVGKDPVVRYFDKGVAKASFPLATSEVYTNQQGETITTTEWHNIVLWRALAEVAEKTVKKGSQVYLVGKIKTRSYVDKDGNNKYITEILADTIMVLDKKPSQNNYSQSESSGTNEGDKTGSPGRINEPGSQYESVSDTGNKNWSDKENPISNDSESGGTFTDDDPAVNQSEDDLPF